MQIAAVVDPLRRPGTSASELVPILESSHVRTFAAGRAGLKSAAVTTRQLPPGTLAPGPEAQEG